MSKRVLIFDPVPFKGGSKEVMKTILSELPSNVEVWVLSNDEKSWCGSQVHFIPLFSPTFLVNQTTGFLYFLKHFIFLFSLLCTLCRVKRFSKVIGISGPCVDFALYLLTSIIAIDVIQLVQGDIANSSVANFGLIRAKKIFYLPSTLNSIQASLNSHGHRGHLSKDKFTPFINGINNATIKTKVSTNKVGFLWAASLVKWKRLELFMAAMAGLNSSVNRSVNASGNSLTSDNNQYYASVCYIKPKTGACSDISTMDNIDNVQWYADPNNLNDIRANSSVFISTAEQEPFGLSILESMVAGLAIVIPADNAYWDQHLTDGFDCIKYQPNNDESLVNALTLLINKPRLLNKIARQAQISSKRYSHLRCYAHILQSIPN
jgi:glycosyltransferase involved in cell wall biosynthesis